MENFVLSVPSGFDIFGHHINFYGITSALAYLLGVVLCCVFAKRRGLKKDDILTLACYVIPFAIIGARLYYVLFRLEYYTNFWDIFKIWEGGLAFYGGMIGGAIAVLLYCLIHKKNFFAIIDIVAVSMILSQALGRWGNFFNQEAFGYEVTDPKWQWFPFAVYIDALDQWHMATFFYEFLWNLLTFGALLLVLFKTEQKGIVACYYLVLYGLGRSLIEGLRTDSLYIGNIRVSQLLSIFFIIIGIAGILYFALTKKKKKDSFDIIMKVLKTDP
ncbi:MAG: prolipoprotein diacylglyceryl transferase [Clostridiales bacterium]|nr:prolipoprotein diacylglyceryl transferase [Clostridiales bacterium]